jgi:DNA-binding transcriptional ArsR family regulator
VTVDTDQCIEALSALGQEARLETFRLLVRTDQDGLTAVEIAKRIGMVHGTLAGHLAVLRRAKLIKRKRNSRWVIYRVELETIRLLILALVWDSCSGDQKLRAGLIAGLGPVDHGSMADIPVCGFAT